MLFVFLTIIMLGVMHNVFYATSHQSRRICNTPQLFDARDMVQHEMFEDHLYEMDWNSKQKLWSLISLNLPTVVSKSRLLLTGEIAYDVIKRNIPGDFVETGVWAGGSSILLYKTLIEFENSSTKYNRSLFACDSFEGLPQPSSADKEGGFIVGAKGDYAYGLNEFMVNMATFHADNPEILKIVPGWFDTTLVNINVQQIAYLRLDGDMYVSTYAPLEALYHKVSSGGIVYVDDFYSFNGCHRAVNDFRLKYNITDKIHDQDLPENFEFSDQGRREAVWWRKSA
jgi:hypothetical protein